MADIKDNKLNDKDAQEVAGGWFSKVAQDRLSTSQISKGNEYWLLARPGAGSILHYVAHIKVLAFSSTGPDDILVKGVTESDDEKLAQAVNAGCALESVQWNFTEICYRVHNNPVNQISFFDHEVH